MLLQLQLQVGVISSELYDRLRTSSGRLPLLYALPKVHKPAVPLRPIASFVYSPTYQLSKHLAHILAPPVGNSTSHVHNSHSFVKYTRQITLQDGECFVSFDVILLFTNILVELALAVAKCRLQDDSGLGGQTSLNMDGDEASACPFESPCSNRPMPCRLWDPQYQ